MIWEFNSAFLQKTIKRSPKSWAMAKTSVDAECNVARSALRQGERSEMKHILLCAVLKVTDWKKCSERVREMHGMKLPEAQELYLRILIVQAKASVTIEWANQPV